MTEQQRTATIDKVNALAETLRDIDGQISGAEDEIWRLQAWRDEVVAQMQDAAGQEGAE